MRVGSLFSGIGGLDLGLERAGMEVVWQVEIDEFCQRVLAQHWPDVARFRDVRDCHGAEADSVDHPKRRRHLEQDGQTAPIEASDGAEDGLPCTTGHLAYVDLICGGFPCQPVSHAGKRRGSADERWLWPEFLRIIREVRPRWALVENVPGLLSIDAGRLFGGVLRDLAESGYDAEWDIVSAADVGAPHLRERVFIVAHTQHARRQQAEAAAPQEGSAPRPGDAGELLGRPQGRGGDVADAATFGRGRRQDDEGQEAPERGGATAGGLSDAEEQSLGAGLREAQQGRLRWGRPSDTDWWSTEPDVGRVAHGVPSRVDRLRGLGNAVVPHVAEHIGRMIMEAQAVRRATE